MPKSFKYSKTFWVNVMVVVVAALTGMMGTDVVASNPELVSYFVAAVATVNIVLRFLTSVPVYAGKVESNEAKKEDN